jgi:hypothetical protein
MLRDAVSLAWELEEIRYTVEGARLLCELTQYGGASIDPSLKTASRSASAILSIAACRLGLFRLTANGELDPDLLRASHNAVNVEEAERNELLLHWDTRRSLRFARRELRRLRFQLRSE